MEFRGDVDVVVRTALPADDAAMAAVFNRSHSHLAGVLARSAADIGWRCRSQPGMSPESAVLVEGSTGAVSGYAFVKNNGDITELAVDPDCPRRRVAAALIAECERRAVSSGADRLRVNVPIHDQDVEVALRGAGLAPRQPEGRHYVASLDPGQLAQILWQGSGTRRSVEVIVTNPFAWQEKKTIIDGGTRPSNISITADQQSLNRILLGGSGPARAVITRRIRIRPWTRTLGGIKWLKEIQVGAPWFHTLGDIL